MSADLTLKGAWDGGKVDNNKFDREVEDSDDKHPNDEEELDEDLMEVDLPVAPSALTTAAKLQKPAAEKQWDNDAIMKALKLSIEAFDDDDVPVWRQPSEAHDVWRPMPVPIPSWVHNYDTEHSEESQAE